MASNENASGMKVHRKRAESMKRDRATWDAHHRELRDFIYPRGARFAGEQVNAASLGSDFHKVIDTHATRAGRVLAAGLMSGMTSPARPWFRLATSDPDLMEYAPVKTWLDKVTRDMRSVFSRSNTYRALHNMYLSLAHMGTAVSTLDDDFDNVVHLQPLLAGQYSIANDERNRVGVLVRNFSMTVEQMVRAFGYDQCSRTVQQMFKRGDRDQWVDVTHILEPNYGRDPSKIDVRNLAFSSCYFETKSNDSKYLRESGMRRFKALAARWDVAGYDAYGTGPGTEALGHVKQLQQEQLSKATGIAYMADPPLQLPTSMKSSQVDSAPGGRTFLDGNQRISSLFDVPLRLDHLLTDIQDVRSSIDSSYYVELFLMLANDTRSNITAREIAERHEEKMLVLGPVLERLHNELLDPLIELTFDRMQRAKGEGGRPMLPEPPNELRDAGAINVEFVSTLAQAQRAVGIGNVERWLGVVSGVAQIKQGILDKVDEDQVADLAADMLGIDASLVVPDDKVDQIRQNRAQQEQMAQAAALAQPAQQAAQAAKTVSEIPQANQKGMAEILSAYTGYGSPMQ